MRYGPGQSAGRIKPAPQPKQVRIQLVRMRSSALAQREGGIGTRPSPHAHGGGGGLAPVASHLTPAQRQRVHSLVAEYMGQQNASASAGRIGHALTQIYSNPILGQKGLAGGIHDFGQTFNPVALERTVAGRAQHPLRLDHAGINAGIIVGGPGGLRVGMPVEETGIPRVTELERRVAGKTGAPEPKGTSAPSPEMSPEERRMGLISSGKKAYKGTVPLRSRELGQRFEAGRVASEQAGHGEAGLNAALGQMKGRLPHVEWKDIQHLPQADFDALVTRLATHPGLQQGEYLKGAQALRNARDLGLPPPPHIQKIWLKAFGPERTKAMLPREQHPLFDLVTFPRAIMSTADLSGILRQGLLGFHQEPAIAARAARNQLRYFRSKDAYLKGSEAIKNDPDFERAQVGKLSLTDIGGEISGREEAFSSKLAEKVPIMAGSSRAYVGGLNDLRMGMFKKQLRRYEAKGRDINDPATLRGIAKQINSATGRGDYETAALRRLAPAGNMLFFSPRLIKSRLDYLNPVWYAKLDPMARSQAVKGATRLAATMATTLYVAHRLGAKIEGDPRSSDFGKLRYGNLRVDPWGGFQQYIRAGSQVATNSRKSVTTGQVESLGSHFGGATQWDVIQGFIHSKFAPVPSFIWDAAQRKSYAGQKFSLPASVANRLVPLLWQDVYSVYKDKGSAGLAALIYGLGGVGLGVQDYKPAPTKAKGPGGSNAFLPSGPSGSSNPYLQSGGGGGSSNPFMP